MRNGYLELAKQEPERIVVLNANQTIEALHQDIVNVINERYIIS